MRHSDIWPLAMAAGLEPCKITLRKPRCRSRAFIKTLDSFFPLKSIMTNTQSKAQPLDMSFPAVTLFERMQHHGSVHQAEIRHSILAQSGHTPNKSHAQTPFSRIGSTRN